MDGQDFLDWNAHKFTSTGKWSLGDWNADGVTDGQDFLLWNGNKFQSSDIGSPGGVQSTSIALQRIDTVFAGLEDRREAAKDRLGADLFDDVVVIDPYG